MKREVSYDDICSVLCFYLHTFFNVDNYDKGVKHLCTICEEFLKLKNKNVKKK